MYLLICFVYFDCLKLKKKYVLIRLKNRSRLSVRLTPQQFSTASDFGTILPIFLISSKRLLKYRIVGLVVKPPANYVHTTFLELVTFFHHICNMNRYKQPSDVDVNIIEKSIALTNQFVIRIKPIYYTYTGNRTQVSQVKNNYLKCSLT